MAILQALEMICPFPPPFNYLFKLPRFTMIEVEYWWVANGEGMKWNPQKVFLIKRHSIRKNK